MHPSRFTPKSGIRHPRARSQLTDDKVTSLIFYPPGPKWTTDVFSQKTVSYILTCQTGLPHQIDVQINDGEIGRRARHELIYMVDQVRIFYQ